MNRVTGKTITIREINIEMIKKFTFFYRNDEETFYRFES